MSGPPTRLLSAPWVVPIATPLIAEGAVLLDGDDRVLDVGTRRDLRARHTTVPEQRCEGAILPALVNAHLHLELSHRSDLRAGVPARGFLAWAEPLWRARAGANPHPVPTQDRAAAAHAAAHDLRAAGVGAVGDIGNGLEALPALADAGLGGVFFHELIGSRQARTGDAVADADRERTNFSAHHGWPAALGYALAPHAPYSVDSDLFRAIFRANADRGVPTSVHVAEDRDEVDLIERGTGGWPDVLSALGVDPRTRSAGVSPLFHLARLGLFDSTIPPLLVHMVYANPDEIALAAKNNATVVLCPRSNLHITGQLPDVPAFIQAGVNLAIGTDSLASSPSLSPWGEIVALRAAFPAVPATLWLDAASRGGARALGLADAGAIATGMRPGLIAVDLSATHTKAADVTATLTSTPDPRVRWLAPLDPTRPATMAFEQHAHV